MIRKLIKSDLEYIDIIGKSIKKNFNEKNNIEEILTSNYRNLYVYEENNIIMGFIETENHFEIIDLVNIAVLDEFRKKGIATKLINYIFINNKGKKILLEVRESNSSAINLYLKNGFYEINRRKKYYENEDAIIMERNI